MWQSLFLISAVPVGAALLARWWFGTRVLAQLANRPCRCNLTVWLPTPENDAAVHRAEHTAVEFATQLRQQALVKWQMDDPKAAGSRDGTHRFGMAVPPLSALVAVLAAVVARLPIAGALAIFLAATALSSVFGILTLPAELAAIARTAKAARGSKAFPHRDDEEAVIACANALAWKHTLPPVLSLVQK
jgi:hypothetical protein